MPILGPEHACTLSSNLSTHPKSSVSRTEVVCSMLQLHHPMTVTDRPEERELVYVSRVHTLDYSSFSFIDTLLR